MDFVRRLEVDLPQDRALAPSDLDAHNRIFDVLFSGAPLAAQEAEDLVYHLMGGPAPKSWAGWRASWWAYAGNAASALGSGVSSRLSNRSPSSSSNGSPADSSSAGRNRATTPTSKRGRRDSSVRQ